MEYIISQILTIVCYGLLGATYLVKKRNLILILSLGSILTNCAAYAFQSAWSGVGATMLAIVRNVIFMIQGKYKKSDKRDVWDWVILFSLLAVAVVIGIFTFNTFWSLFTIFAGMVYTISVWQKNNMVYNILGAVSSAFAIVYYVFIGSLFGTILESCLFIVTVVGMVMYILKHKKEKEVKDGISVSGEGC